MTISVAGAAGFIPSHLVERLLDQHNITIYDNIHRNALKFTSFANHSRLTFIQGLALDLNALTQAMATAKVFPMPQSSQEAIALTERQPYHEGKHSWRLQRTGNG